MGCNCEPKKYSVSMGCCQPVLAPIENYYTKYEIDEIVEGLEISGGCCITEEEVDNKIESAKTEIENEIPSLSGYATEQWVLDKHYISGVDLSNYALKSEIPTVPTKVSAFENDVPYLTEHQSLSGYATEAFVSAYTYDKATIDEKVASGGTFDPTNYYNKTEVNNIVNSAKTEVENEIPSLNGYATEQWVLDKHYISGVDLSDYATHQWVEDKHYITGVDLSDYATEQWVLDKHYISGVDLSDYALKSEIPVVPTSNTAFTNDAGYLTEHQPLKTINNQVISGTGNITISAETDNNKQNIANDGYLNSFTVQSSSPYYNTIVKFKNAENSGNTTANTQTYPIYIRTINGYDIVSTTAFNNQLRLATQSDFSAHTASTTIHVTQSEKNTWNSKVDSTTLNNYMLKTQIWCGTQAEYDAITTKDNSVIYLIHE